MKRKYFVTEEFGQHYVCRRDDKNTYNIMGFCASRSIARRVASLLNFDHELAQVLIDVNNNRDEYEREFNNIIPIKKVRRFKLKVPSKHSSIKYLQCNHDGKSYYIYQNGKEELSQFWTLDKCLAEVGRGFWIEF